jgi:rubrerythrin
MGLAAGGQEGGKGGTRDKELEMESHENEQKPEGKGLGVAAGQGGVEEGTGKSGEREVWLCPRCGWQAEKVGVGEVCPRCGYRRCFGCGDGE